VRSLALLIATAGGIGYAPIAPGTWGSLLVVPCFPLLGALDARSVAAHAAVVGAVVLVGIWAAGRANVAFGAHDHACIVIDEVGGMLIASLCVPCTWATAWLVFVLFRVFDVWKPFPANRIDRRCSGGIGVVADDAVAGVYAGLVARLVLEVP
jgi:phosphatidylglycerophosphatase A